MSVDRTSVASAQTQAQIATVAVVVEKQVIKPRFPLMSFSNMLGIGDMTRRTLDAQKPQSPQTPAANAARRFGI